MPWKLRCAKCGKEELLMVGYDIRDFKQLYLYCEKCKENTFHEILGYVEGSGSLRN